MVDWFPSSNSLSTFLWSDSNRSGVHWQQFSLEKQPSQSVLGRWDNIFLCQSPKKSWPNKKIHANGDTTDAALQAVGLKLVHRNNVSDMTFKCSICNPDRNYIMMQSYYPSWRSFPQLQVSFVMALADHYMSRHSRGFDICCWYFYNGGEWNFKKSTFIHLNSSVASLCENSDQVILDNEDQFLPNMSAGHLSKGNTAHFFVLGKVSAVNIS